MRRFADRQDPELDAEFVPEITTTGIGGRSSAGGEKRTGQRHVDAARLHDLAPGLTNPLRCSGHRAFRSTGLKWREVDPGKAWGTRQI
jgi:hypothetical protein